MLTVLYRPDKHGHMRWEIKGADLRTQGRFLDAIPTCRVRGHDGICNITRRGMQATADEPVESVTARVLALAQSLAA